jgi:hypothetical protein
MSAPISFGVFFFKLNLIVKVSFTRLGLLSFSLFKATVVSQKESKGIQNVAVSLDSPPSHSVR